MTDYTPSGYPDPSTRWVSALLDAEFALIQTAVNSKLNKDLYYSGTEAQGATVNDYVVTVSPAPTSYATRSFLAFKATHTNSGAATVAISGLSAKTLKNVEGAALSANSIESGSAVLLFYDGTDYYLISCNDRAAKSGEVYAGTHDYTGATLRSASPLADNDVATREYANNLAFSGTGYITDVVQDTSPQLGGNLDCNGKTINASSALQIADASLGTGTHTFDYSQGDMQQLTATGSITIAFSNFVTGKVCAMIIDAVNWGAYTITLPGGMLFSNATSPYFTVSGTDRLVVLKDKDDVYTMTIVNQGLA